MPIICSFLSFPPLTLYKSYPTSTQTFLTSSYLKHTALFFLSIHHLSLYHLYHIYLYPSISVICYIYLSICLLSPIFFFLTFNFIYLFIYLWLCWVFVSVQGRQVGATLHRGARASHYRGLSCCGAQAPDAQAQ